MPISGKTRVVVHLTYPAKHLRTPEFFNPLLERLGYDGVLVPWEVSPANLATAWEGLRGIENLAGVIVTVPHKLEVATLCDELKGTALLLKVCNVAKRLADGRFTGRMFDGDGFVAGLKKQGHDLSRKRVLLLGAGGHRDRPRIAGRRYPGTGDQQPHVGQSRSTGPGTAADVPRQADQCRCRRCQRF